MYGGGIRTRYSPEVRERAVRMVPDRQGEYESQWAAIGAMLQAAQGRRAGQGLDP